MGLLSKLKRRMSGQKSHFDLGLETVIRQNAVSAAALRFRTRATEPANPPPDGRPGRFARLEKKLADVTADRVARPAMALTKPSEIPSPAQVHRPEKDKLGQFNAKWADKFRPVRKTLREAPSEALNGYLTGKHRREALKEVGKRVRYEDVNEDKYRNLISWFGHPILTGDLRAAKACGNERVAEVAATMAAHIAHVKETLEDRYIASARRADETSRSAAHRHAKTSKALDEMLTGLYKARLALAQECVVDEALTYVVDGRLVLVRQGTGERPGEDEARTLIGTLDELARPLEELIRALDALRQNESKTWMK
jgi:hypothetical protein